MTGFQRALSAATMAANPLRPTAAATSRIGAASGPSA